MPHISRTSPPFALFRHLMLAVLLAPAMLASALPGLDGIEVPAGFEQRLGFAPGERHPHHHELLTFYRSLAAESDRVAIETIGNTYGGREQVLLYFGTPERLAELDRIRADRIRASRDGDGPAVVWLGYSVHGNEASGASAAPIVAWTLAHSENEQVRRWRDELLIVMEPMINPDGIDRFAHWVDMHRGANPSADPNDREHNETWPNGRTSYYWFDLNRDWMPLTHPASRNRINHYKQWRPHVLTDAHEMGHRSTYFFQPGIPERNNPATPERVFELTAKIAEFHGRILDRAGEPYYARESFDDYYLGKGSTYPDLTGGVGILFEQGSSRGHLMETPYGERSFADAIANQVRTSISTLEAALALAPELIEHQQRFFAEVRDIGGDGGWLIGDDGDPARAARLLRTLLGHGIEIRSVNGEVRIGERDFGPGTAWAIPDAQDQARFIRALFDTPTELPMETFYDVSAWPLQHAFDLPLREVRRLPSLGAALTEAELPRSRAAAIDTEAVAWAIDWRQHRAPAVLAALLAEGYRVQALGKPARLDTAAGPVALGRGAVIVQASLQAEHLAPVYQVLERLAAAHEVRIESVRRGLALGGIDLGSPSAPMLETPKPLLITGEGVSPNTAGQAWHWFDRWLDQPVTRVDAGDLPRNLAEYSHIILPGGNFRAPDGFAKAVTDFVHGGGQLIAMGQAAEWAESLELEWGFVEPGKGKGKEADEEGDRVEPRPYADHEQDFARTLIGGSALDVELDPTHPLAWGYERDAITLFRQGAHVLKTSTNAYAAPGRYSDTPLVAGYLAAPVAAKLVGTPAIAADRLGAGLVVRIADDVLFRGYWAGAEKILANALFFGQLISPTRMPD